VSASTLQRHLPIHLDVSRAKNLDRMNRVRRTVRLLNAERLRYRLSFTE
jgi:hypothetical protein